jgi:hypothetical protein
VICLNNLDTLEGGASVNTVVDYTVHGLVAGAFAVIAQGQLSNTNPSVLYTAASGISIVSIILVNTHSAAVTVDLYIDPANAGTPRRLIPKTLSLEPGYSLHFDGQRCVVLTNGGVIVTGINVSDAVYDSGWDGITNISPSKNAVYDQMQLKLTGSYATAAEIIAGTAGLAIAPDQLAAVPVKLGEWTAYTPTVIPESGTFTNVTAEGRWTQIGKIGFFNVVVTETDIGSGTGTINVATPAAVAAPFVCTGSEAAINGKVLKGSGSASNTIRVWYYDNSVPLANGLLLRLSGIFEIA